jgi:hypothetical protein
LSVTICVLFDETYLVAVDHALQDLKAPVGLVVETRPGKAVSILMNIHGAAINIICYLISESPLAGQVHLGAG